MNLEWAHFGASSEGAVNGVAHMNLGEFSLL